MPTYASAVEKAIEQYSVNELIIANDLYQSISNEITEAVYYKNLERLCKSKKLNHLAKGIYYRPKMSSFGEIPISSDQVIKYYVKNYKGLVIGYKLYNKKGLTTQIGKKTVVLSNQLREEQKNIGDVLIKRINLKLDKKTVASIEMLEVLQNYDRIEDFNGSGFISYFKEFSKQYSDHTIDTILLKMKYKKSTIAFMQKCLSIFGIENSLSKYLSSMSTYKIPNMENINEFTS